MPGPDRRVPKSYDEIVRSTVPDPDGSKRPTARQEQLAREGYRHLDAAELALCMRVIDALEDALRCSNDTWGFDVDVAREVVTLRGQVRDPATAALVEKTVRDVDGVESVTNQIVVGR